MSFTFKYHKQYPNLLFIYEDSILWAIVIEYKISDKEKINIFDLEVNISNSICDTSIFALYVTFQTLFSQYVNTLDVFDGFFLKITTHQLQWAVIMICMSYYMLDISRLYPVTSILTFMWEWVINAIFPLVVEALVYVIRRVWKCLELLNFYLIL